MFVRKITMKNKKSSNLHLKYQYLKYGNYLRILLKSVLPPLKPSLKNVHPPFDLYVELFPLKS